MIGHDQRATRQGVKSSVCRRVTQPHPRHRLNEPELQQAAVAVAVGPTDTDAAGFVLTRRAAGLRSHPHQYALPGGRVDPGETPTDAARRELSEEVGINAGDDAVLGLLDDYRTRSGYVITPVVMWLEGFSGMVAQPTEVDEIHIIKLDELDRRDSPRWISIAESDLLVLQLPLRDRLIHAPTGAVLYQFREVCLWARLARIDTIEEPVWAWR
ncbi:MAG: CoA pyrophosphatase [Acidimicrobiales bacterium]